MFQQPFAEQIADFKRQAQQHIARFPRARLKSCLQNAFDLGIRQCRNNRRDHHRHRNGGFSQLPDRVQPLRRRCRPGLHFACEPPVQCRDRKRHFDEPPLGHRRKQINIARHKGRFRHNADRVVEPRQNLQHLTHDPPLPLDWLVGVGIRADRNRTR